MIVDKALYVNGERQACGDLSQELDRLRHDGSGYLWIGLKNPSDRELDFVNRELGLHELAVEDIKNGNVRAKLERYDDVDFAVVKTLRYIDSSSDIETGEVMVVIGDRFALTVRKGDMNPLAGVRRRLEADRSRLELGPTAVLHAVLDSVVDNYIVIDREVRKDLDEIEQLVFQDADVDVNAIYRLKREVLEFRRASFPLAESLESFHDTRQMADFPEDVLPFFRDVQDHLNQVNDHVESYDRLLTDVLNAHLARIGVKQNEDMRKISAWVAIAAVPTMLAGIYGMNFHFIPELEASVHVAGHEVFYGYFIIIGIMIASSLGLYRKFKRSGWL